MNAVVLRQKRERKRKRKVARTESQCSVLIRDDVKSVASTLDFSHLHLHPSTQVTKPLLIRVDFTPAAAEDQPD